LKAYRIQKHIEVEEFETTQNLKEFKITKNFNAQTLHALTFECKELLQMKTKVSVRRKHLPFSCSSKILRWCDNL
jgi:sucrose-6-phosphate hydrolase SacC (GH32 family)